LGINFFDAVYRVVLSIPHGRVGTYGEVALMSGRPGAARQVGWALHCLPWDTDVPWHRVINAKGGISLRGRMGEADLQRALLIAEGVEFDERDRVDLDRFGYRPHPQKGGAGRD
jgi:methylated-DNA-protein-cysteine methyltransferase-like protein